MRLTPPTKTTFTLSLLAILLGIATSPEVGWIDGLGTVSFYLLAGGALLLVLGVLFRRI